MSLSALLERVESATGGDRELDRDLGVSLLAWGREVFADEPWLRDGISLYRDEPSGRYPKFTASVDAALALIGRVKPGADPKIWRWRGQWGASLHDPENGSMVIAQHHYSPTPALALCAALLAAMIGEEAKPSPPSTVTP